MSRPTSSGHTPNYIAHPRSAAIDFAQRPGERYESPAVTSSLDNHRSSSGDSNPQQWFDKANNNPRESNAFHADRKFQLDDLRRSRRLLTLPIDGAPFHIQDTSRQGSQAPPPPTQHAFPASMMLPFRNMPQHTPVQDEHLEDYRSVIDDLTIRNKILKAKLKQYERAASAVDSDKLFEIKIHGLSPIKKRELEETLKTFVRNLDQPTVPANGNSPPSETTNLAALSTIAKPGSSHTSTKFADSGYGSMTASNQGLSQRGPKKPVNGATRINNGVEASRARNRNIQSYLHDIPEGLMPSQAPAVMTDDSKKRLVVLRLEHLFVGRGAAADGHQQPMQQQEVSQSAARDERTAIEAKGQRAVLEGKREAAIMSSDADESHEPMATKFVDAPVALPRFGSEKTLEQGSVEQRPTRPLDLDPHRAQDPCENIKYLRHLGFKLSDEEADTVVTGDNDWLYLNLVMNMAQLHTLNVTSDLVKDAVKDYSSRFELSPDGRKIRWRTEPLPQILPIDTIADPSVMSTNVSSSGVGNGRKRPRPLGLNASSSLESSDQSSSKKQSAVLGSSGRSYNVPPYTGRAGTSELADDVAMFDTNSIPSYNVAEDPTTHDSSAWTSSGNLLSQAQVQQPDDNGPIVFYRKQNFFTDMTGDRGKPAHVDRSSYQLQAMRPLGARVPSLSRENSTNDSLSVPIQTAASHASLDVNADSNSNHDKHSVRSDGRHVSFADTLEPYTFHASGIGCTYPADNFAMYVTREFEEDEAPPVKRRRIARVAEAIPQSMTQAKTSILDTITSVKGQMLEPSPLPPPMFAVSVDGSEAGSDDEEHEESSYEYTEDSSQEELEAMHIVPPSEEPTDDGKLPDADDVNALHAEVDDDEIDDVPSMVSEVDSEPAEDQPAPVQRPVSRLETVSSSRTGRSESRNSRAAQSRSPSVDLLATARQADPQAIREREREYDAELAERLAEEMPAGSSAATCGGQPGSGNNSPTRAGMRRMYVDDDVDDEEDAEDGSVSS
ncbi:MAG: hypothetical protein Q9159_006010 [Coniocarpon cinnabarinum]